MDFALKRPSSLGEGPKKDTSFVADDKEAPEGDDPATEAGDAFGAAVKSGDGAAIAETFRRLRDATV